MNQCYVCGLQIQIGTTCEHYHYRKEQMNKTGITIKPSGISSSDEIGEEQKRESERVGNLVVQNDIERPLRPEIELRDIYFKGAEFVLSQMRKDFDCGFQFQTALQMSEGTIATMKAELMKGGK